VNSEAPLRRPTRAAAPLVRFTHAMGPAAGVALLVSSSAAGSAERVHRRPAPPPKPPDPPSVTPSCRSMAAVNETAAAWVVASFRVPAFPPFLPHACVPTARTPTELHASLLLPAYAGAAGNSSVIRVGEHLSAPVAQVNISRSKIRWRQEVPIALVGRRFDAPMRSELVAWHNPGVYVEVPDEGKIAISMQWVLKEKPAELSEDPAKLKARLLVRCFEDHQKALVVSTSPTVGRAPLREVLALITKHG